MAGFSRMGASGIGEKTPSVTQKVSLKGPKLYLSLKVHLRPIKEKKKRGAVRGGNEKGKDEM